MNLIRDKSELTGEDGFTLLETLLSIVIFSVALVAMASVSLTVVHGNQTSKHYIEASILAQSQLENLRNTGFLLGSDAVLGLGSPDDVIPQVLTNINTANDSFTDPAAMFQSPDHAYTLAGGVETTPVLDSPTLTPSTTLRRAWVVRDNLPTPGMKTVTIIVGWKEGTVTRYVTATSAMQGQ